MVETAAFAGIVRLRGGENDPKFGAGRLRVSVPLQGLRPLPEPTVEVAGGYVQPLPDLGLTGIKGPSPRRRAGAGRRAPGAGHRPRGQLRRRARVAVDAPPAR